ncbi:MAG TPA: MurT ligase domain-containing protein [Solirubrobacteraceae bacterium]|nr:MurT ligase domain-containing protein [Solirubrobacteraceae bacterium]
MNALDLEAAAARAVGRLVRVAGRGGGTSLPGLMLTRLAPDAIARLAVRLKRGSVAISATNGKTTTAAMAAAVLSRAGVRLVHNHAGANMAGGVAAALAQAARPGGGIDGDMGLFELDELWLDRVVAQLRPRAILLGNLFRDQLDRYGELHAIAQRWEAAIAGPGAEARLVCNADDPLIADLAREHPRATFYGVADPSVALERLPHAADSKHCRRCGAAYVYEAVHMGHLGVYHCPSCGRRRPEPSVQARGIRLDGTRAAAFSLHARGQSAEVSLRLPGLYNVYNALGAAALCLELGVQLADVADGLSAVDAAFGRSERVAIGGRELAILLVKNPAGANEVLRTLSLEPGPLSLLAALNDRVADGRDVSWIWDADFELLAGRAAHVVCSGTRAAELALRLKYAGVDERSLEVAPRLDQALERALDSCTGTVYALPTYTALLELRALLARGGHADRFWERRR